MRRLEAINVALWNPWHGCHKLSAGCLNCYVYRTDAKYEKDSSVVTKNNSFDMPIKKNRKGEYKLKGDDIVYTCFTSDFFVEDADEWRVSAWEMIRERNDLEFLMITKRINRFYVKLPDDWGDGYDNVTICCTTENQQIADYRLPIYLATPIKNKIIIAEPLLTDIDFSAYLDGQVKHITVGGESGNNARVCDYNWILNIRRQCEEADISFKFKQTGANFRKDGKLYTIPRKLQHKQASRAGIDIRPPELLYKEKIKQI